jgi:hypothetical protein
MYERLTLTSLNLFYLHYLHLNGSSWSLLLCPVSEFASSMCIYCKNVFLLQNILINFMSIRFYPFVYCKCMVHQWTCQWTSDFGGRHFHDFSGVCSIFSASIYLVLTLCLSCACFGRFLYHYGSNAYTVGEKHLFQRIKCWTNSRHRFDESLFGI